MEIEDRQRSTFNFEPALSIMRVDHANRETTGLFAMIDKKLAAKLRNLRK